VSGNRPLGRPYLGSISYTLSFAATAVQSRVLRIAMRANASDDRFEGVVVAMAQIVETTYSGYRFCYDSLSLCVSFGEEARF